MTSALFIREKLCQHVRFDVAVPHPVEDFLVATGNPVGHGVRARTVKVDEPRIVQPFVKRCTLAGKSSFSNLATDSNIAEILWREVRHNSMANR